MTQIQQIEDMTHKDVDSHGGSTIHEVSLGRSGICCRGHKHIIRCLDSLSACVIMAGLQAVKELTH